MTAEQLDMRWRVRERWRGLLLFLLLMGGYVYTFPRWADPNENSRLDMVIAIVDDHTFQIDPYVANTVDYATRGGHFYSDKAPGIALLGVPIYAAIKPILSLPVLQPLEQRLQSSQTFVSTLRSQGSGILLSKIRFALTLVVLTFFLAAVPTALLGVAMYLWLVTLMPSPWLRVLVVCAYALASPAFAYAEALYGHQLAAALLFGTFLLAYGGARHMAAARLLGIGALMGAAVLVEFPSAIVAGVLGLYVLSLLAEQRNWMRVVWLFAGGAPFALGWIIYNRAVFGGLLSLGYQYSTLWQAQHDSGFMSLNMPTWSGAWGITFGVFRGLFVLSPIMLVAAIGFIPWHRSGFLRREFWVALAATGSMFLFNASSIMWWGGFAVGPRYLLPGLPFLALGLAFALRQWQQIVFRIAASLALLCSLVATWGLTLAEQAFPSDAIANPLLQFAWPNWLQGNIARNLGTLLGLRGPASLLPLAALGGVLALVWTLVTRDHTHSIVIGRTTPPLRLQIDPGAQAARHGPEGHGR
jgi:hypothetical protein